MIRNRKVKLPPGDDGRTIVSMNVEGMPGYSPTRKKMPENDTTPAPNHASPLSREESRVYLWGAIKAGLLIVLVMSAFLVLFVLFCQHVWFR